VDDRPRPSSLRLDTVTNEPGAVVIVRGDVDAATAPQLEAVIDELLDETVREIELDMTELTFLDSSGVSVIAGALRRLAGIDGSPSMRGVSPLVRELLHITDLLRFVEIIGDD
jgi:anti-anti-sigma factor